MNCAAISAMLQSSTLVKSYNSSEERIHVVSFKRTKENHDKLPHLNNSLITRHNITLHIICINFQVVPLKITSENLELLMQIVNK